MHFARSSKLMCSVRERQQKSGCMPLELKLWNVTRWAGEFYALERFIQLEPFLREVYEEADIANDIQAPSFPNEEEVQFLSLYHRVLVPFEELMKHLQDATIPTLSGLPMSIKKLQCTLNEKESDPPRVKQMKNGLNKALEKRFGFVFEKKNLALLAAAVDPRYGDLSFVSDSVRNDVWKQLEEEMQHLLQIPKADGKPQTVNNMIVIVDNTQIVQSALHALRHHLEHNANQLHRSKCNPLQWWKEQTSEESAAAMRSIAPLARMLLSIPASEASAERVFSSYTNTLSGRELLAPDKSEAMLMIHHYMHHPGYNANQLLNAAMEKVFDK